VGTEQEYRIEDINAAAVVYANYSKSRFQRQRCHRDARGKRRRRERRARKPCTVTAPARVAGHRLPVWATKIGGFSLLTLKMKEKL
jgi:hypothetical protein